MLCVRVHVLKMRARIALGATFADIYIYIFRLVLLISCLFVRSLDWCLTYAHGYAIYMYITSVLAPPKEKQQKFKSLFQTNNVQNFARIAGFLGALWLMLLSDTSSYIWLIFLIFKAFVKLSSSRPLFHFRQWLILININEQILAALWCSLSLSHSQIQIKCRHWMSDRKQNSLSFCHTLNTLIFVLVWHLSDLNRRRTKIVRRQKFWIGEIGVEQKMSPLLSLCRRDLTTTTRRRRQRRFGDRRRQCW